MPARLRAHPIAVADPTRAAHQVAAAALGDAPRGRPLLVAVVRWGAHPGLRPSPWCLDGVLHAIEDAGLRARTLHRGERGAADPLTARLTARGLSPIDEHGPTIALRPTGSRTALRIPRAVLGHNLCLVLPCVHHHRPGKDGPTWRGPIGAALVELIAAWGGTWTRNPVDRAARCVAELFPHVSVVIDAGWWAPLSHEDEGAPLLLSPERALGLRLPSPITGEAALDPRLADAWIGTQLGLPLRRRPGEAPRVVGPAARTPWPKLPRTAPRSPTALGRARRMPTLADAIAAGSQPLSTATEAFGALWRRADRPAPRRAALPPAVPGPLAALWDEYERTPRPA